MNIQRRSLVLLVIAALLVIVLPAGAGQTVLSINSGTENVSWFITGEPTLVMNGFDLNAFRVALPAIIDRVSLTVDQPTPSVPVELVVYEDANGGSPVDARLAGRATLTITASGVFTTTLATPITVNAPAVWVGFYLPVDFRFMSDASGSSVLTYWGWTPGTRFDLTNLGTASVFGPSDGSAPVNLDLDGKARITAEITGAGGTGTTLQPTPIGTTTGGALTPDGGTIDTSVLAGYTLCASVLWDTADERISYGDRINPHCREVQSWNAPASPSGYTLRSVVYDLVFFKENGVVVLDRLEFGVTHCIRPDAAYLATAVIGSAYGAPRQWRILPSQRFGDLVCAEVRRGGTLGLFSTG